MLQDLSARHSFLQLDENPLYGHAVFYLPVFEFMDIWGGSHPWATRTNAAMNICVQVFCVDVFPVLSGIPPGVELL